MRRPSRAPRTRTHAVTLLRQKAVRRSLEAQGGLAATEVSLTEPKAGAPSVASIIVRAAG